MFRRLFVSVLVAALTLAVVPRPASGLGDDHLRCMYRCRERGDSYRAPFRSPAVRPLRHNCPCGWHGSGHRPGWYGDGWYHRPSRGTHWDRRDRRDRWDRWDGHGGGGHRWRRWDRWDHRDRWERPGDRSRGSGYDAHRHHPRGRDF